MTRSRASKTVLVLSVGNTPEPGATSIKHHRPDHIVFFVSQKSNKKTVPKILEAVPGFAALARVVLLDPEAEFEFSSSYTTALEAMQAAMQFTLQVIKVDIAGGTKPMTAALVFAAIQTLETSQQSLNFHADNGVFTWFRFGEFQGHISLAK